MPEAIKKLTEAKKAGIIVDFKKVRPDVFQVQHQGSIFGEQMRKSGRGTFAGGGEQGETPYITKNGHRLPDCASCVSPECNNQHLRCLSTNFG